MSWSINNTRVCPISISVNTSNDQDAENIVYKNCCLQTQLKLEKGIIDAVNI